RVPDGKPLRAGLHDGVAARALDVVQDEVAGGVPAEHRERALELDLMAHASRGLYLEAHARGFPPGRNRVRILKERSLDFPTGGVVASTVGTNEGGRSAGPPAHGRRVGRTRRGSARSGGDLAAPTRFSLGGAELDEDAGARTRSPGVARCRGRARRRVGRTRRGSARSGGDLAAPTRFSLGGAGVDGEARAGAPGPRRPPRSRSRPR